MEHSEVITLFRAKTCQTIYGVPIAVYRFFSSLTPVKDKKKGVFHYKNVHIKLPTSQLRRNLANNFRKPKWSTLSLPFDCQNKVKYVNLFYGHLYSKSQHIWIVLKENSSNLTYGRLCCFFSELHLINIWHPSHSYFVPKTKESRFLIYSLRINRENFNLKHTKNHFGEIERCSWYGFVIATLWYWT